MVLLASRAGVAPRRNRVAGVSLVELMVTIVVLAIILAIGAPSFTGVFNNNRLATQANQLVAGLQEARSEAVRSNTRVTVCRSDDGAACAADLGNWARWLVVGADGTVLRDNSSKAPVELSGSVASLVFAPDGRARAADGGLLDATLVACIPTTRPGENQREIAVRTGGRVSIESVNGAGVCP